MLARESIPSWSEPITATLTGLALDRFAILDTPNPTRPINIMMTNETTI